MEIKSRDLSASEAIAEIKKLTNPEDLPAFISDGEDRTTVLKAADDRLAELTSTKQGELKGPITKDSPDFKEGVQKVKSFVTCEDVIAEMRKRGRKI